MYGWLVQCDTWRIFTRMEDKDSYMAIIMVLLQKHFWVFIQNTIGNWKGLEQNLIGYWNNKENQQEVLWLVNDQTWIQMYGWLVQCDSRRIFTRMEEEDFLMAIIMVLLLKHFWVFIQNIIGNWKGLKQNLMDIGRTKKIKEVLWLVND